MGLLYDYQERLKKGFTQVTTCIFESEWLEVDSIYGSMLKILR